MIFSENVIIDFLKSKNINGEIFKYKFLDEEIKTPYKIIYSDTKPRKKLSIKIYLQRKEEQFIYNNHEDKSVQIIRHYLRMREPLIYEYEYKDFINFKLKM
jgi:hypothetical protein